MRARAARSASICARHAPLLVAMLMSATRMKRRPRDMPCHATLRDALRYIVLRYFSREGGFTPRQRRMRHASMRATFIRAWREFDAARVYMLPGEQYDMFAATQLPLRALFTLHTAPAAISRLAIMRYREMFTALYATRHHDDAITIVYTLRHTPRHFAAAIIACYYDGYAALFCLRSAVSLKMPPYAMPRHAPPLDAATLFACCHTQRVYAMPPH